MACALVHPCMCARRLICGEKTAHACHGAHIIGLQPHALHSDIAVTLQLHLFLNNSSNASCSAFISAPKPYKNVYTAGYTVSSCSGGAQLRMQHDQATPDVSPTHCQGKPRRQAKARRRCMHPHMAPSIHSPLTSAPTRCVWGYSCRCSQCHATTAQPPCNSIRPSCNLSAASTVCTRWCM